MPTKSYSEKLKDPRWQKKRLEILERDDFTCQRCFAKDKTLQIHHWKYAREPWDVENGYLITLCEDCHEDVRELFDSLIELMAYYFQPSYEVRAGDVEGCDLGEKMSRMREWMCACAECSSDAGIKKGRAEHILSELTRAIYHTGFKAGFRTREEMEG